MSDDGTPPRSADSTSRPRGAERRDAASMENESRCPRLVVNRRASSATARRLRRDGPCRQIWPPERAVVVEQRDGRADADAKARRGGRRGRRLHYDHVEEVLRSRCCVHLLRMHDLPIAAQRRHASTCARPSTALRGIPDRHPSHQRTARGSPRMDTACRSRNRQPPAPPPQSSQHRPRQPAPSIITRTRASPLLLMRHLVHEPPRQIRLDRNRRRPPTICAASVKF